VSHSQNFSPLSVFLAHFLTPDDHQLLGMLLSNQTLAAGGAKRRNWSKGDEILVL